MGHVTRLATWGCATLLAGGLAACGGGPQAAGPHPLERTAGTPDPSPSAAGPTGGTEKLPKGVVMRISDPRIAESSGLAASHLHPGVAYTHNDRGESAKLYAVDATGTRAVLDLTAEEPRDWEDVATTPDGRIWVADTGDNDRVRENVQVLVLSEPDILVSGTVSTTAYAFRFPDGPQDVEALLVDPRDERIFLVSKDPEGGRIYAAPETLSADGVNRLEVVGEAPPAVSGAAWSPDGSVLVLRNHRRAYFHRELGDEAVEVELPKMPQGESITFTPDGTHVWVGSEGVDSVVRQVALPRMPRR